jgi:type I restriction enzyme S subunit
MAELKEASLDDVCSLVTDGTHDTPKRIKDGFPLIKAKEIVGGKIDFEACDQISEEEHLRVIARSKPEYGDTLFAHIGASLGEAAFVKTHRPFSIKNIALFKPDLNIINERYLYYLVISPDFQGRAKQTKTGSAQPFLSLGHLRSHRIAYNEALHEQRKIAAILSAYDDLIENNLRRIKILEEMAQNLYREWFVKFRFPGHQHARFTDSPLGRVPEGWEVEPFTEIADVLSGGTPKTTVQEYWGGSIPFFAPKDAPESFYVTNTEKAITELGLRKCNSNLYPKDTVFITARGTVGKVVMPSMDMAMNQSCYALRGKQGISQLYLFLATKEHVDYLKKNTGGATFDTIVVDTFRRMLVAKPGNEIIGRFSQLIQPGMELILNILMKNTALRRTRDLLLPRLISGEVDVSELDITVPGEVAV